MSVVGGGDIPRPTSPHADVILGTLWPLQSESAWQGFASEIKSEATRLFGEDGAQQDILRLVAVDQTGAFIEAATNLVRVSSSTLEARYQTYNDASSVAQGVGTRIWAIKLRMTESVATAETEITAAENELEPQIQAATAALDGLRASLLTAELQGRITAAITQAQTEVTAEAATGAAQIAGLNTKMGDASSDSAGGATPLDWDGGGAGTPTAPAMPAPTTPGGNGVQAVDYDTFKEGTEPLSDRMPETRQAEEPTLSKAAQDSSRFPDEVKARDAASAPHGDAGKSGTSAMPPATSAPSTGGGGSPASSGGNPASVLGSAMRPMSSAPSSSAPASSGAPASGSPASGMSGTGTPAAQTGSGGAGAAGTGSGAAASGVSRAVGGASAGAGIAEASARMGTGAVSAAANAVGTAGNVGAQIAHSTSSTAAPPPAAGPPPGPVGTSPPSAAGPAPMAMISPTPAPAAAVAGGLTPAAPAGPAAAGPGIPGTPQQPGPASASTTLGGASAGGPGANATPVMVPMSQVRAVGLDGATGDMLIGQAADAARSIVETVIAQTRHAGYGSSQGFVWAVTVIAERTGEVTAWLATSEGPSYIPRGVRVPDDVRLAVTDPVMGRQLWDAAAAAGGADPLEVLARHVELRDAAAPGLRVLAFAASVPMSRVIDWAATVGARPVSVDPRTIDPAPAHGDHGQHRCAIAMPWEWQQANAFSERQRLQVATRHMLMAASAGHLNDPACERVIDAFERGEPITDSDWADVRQAMAVAWVNYEMARSGVTMGGGATPAEWAFRTARAAEVVYCLRDHRSAEGCADLLYATRLAGAPLNPAAAVA